MGVYIYITFFIKFKKLTELQKNQLKEHFSESDIGNNIFEIQSSFKESYQSNYHIVSEYYIDKILYKLSIKDYTIGQLVLCDCCRHDKTILFEDDCDLGCYNSEYYIDMINNIIKNDEINYIINPYFEKNKSIISQLFIFAKTNQIDEFKKIFESEIDINFINELFDIFFEKSKFKKYNKNYNKYWKKLNKKLNYKRYKIEFEKMILSHTKDNFTILDWAIFNQNYDFVNYLLKNNTYKMNSDTIYEAKNTKCKLIIDLVKNYKYNDKSGIDEYNISESKSLYYSVFNDDWIDDDEEYNEYFINDNGYEEVIDRDCP